jgi:MtN3 and saliva related transmembrane protein
MDGIIWTIIGTCAAALTSFSFLPQVRKIWQHRSARDVSSFTMWQLTAGNFLWFTYGIGRHDWVIIGANIVAISILFAGLALYYRYHIKEEVPRL